MPLFLTGGGEQECFKDLDNAFLDLLPKHSRIGILPHATDNYAEALERIEEEFDHPNIASFELALDVSEAMPDFQAIMIEGGNTFELALAMRNSAFFNYLKKFHSQGKPIYADSAGAILLGSDIQTAFLGDDSDEDDKKLQDYRGLDLISPFAIHAHATAFETEDLTNLLYDNGNPILALGENSGVFIQGDDIKVYGEEPLTCISFTGVQILSPGTETNLRKLQEG